MVSEEHRNLRLVLRPRFSAEVSGVTLALANTRALSSCTSKPPKQERVVETGDWGPFWSLNIRSWDETRDPFTLLSQTTVLWCTTNKSALLLNVFQSAGGWFERFQRSFPLLFSQLIVWPGVSHIPLHVLHSKTLVSWLSWPKITGGSGCVPHPEVCFIEHYRNRRES